VTFTFGSYPVFPDEQKPYVPESCCVTDTYYRVLNVDICQKWKLGPPGTLAKGAYNHGLNYNVSGQLPRLLTRGGLITYKIFNS